MITYQSLFNYAKETLLPITDEASLEAEILLLECFNLSKSQFLLCKLEFIQDEHELKRFYDLVSDRKTGKPLAYVLGHWEFFGSRYLIEPGVLVPRPETELLVETAIKQLEALSKEYEQTDIKVLELGFGSGIISIECAKRFPEISFMAWDISDVAYRVARENAKKFDCKNIDWVRGDFFDDEDMWSPILNSDSPTLLLSNPPYIPTQDIEQLDSVVKDFEPFEALDGGVTGLNYISSLLALYNQGKNISFICEMGYNQKEEIEKLLNKYVIQTAEFINDYQSLVRLFFIT